MRTVNTINETMYLASKHAMYDDDYINCVQPESARQNAIKN